jgi:ABC-type multidrug transport system fused ATPase/permease subunit
LSSKAKIARQNRSNLARNFGEVLAAVGAYQTFGAGRRAIRQVARRASDVRQAAIGQARAAGGIQAVAEAATTAMPTLCLLSAAIFGAEPAAAFAGIAIASILSPRLRDLGRVAEYWTTAQIAQARIASTFSGMLRPNRTPSLEVNADLGGVAFEQFSVPPTLRNISGQAFAGERIALVGPNGSGKSMLLLALAGLAPHRGSLVIDGWQASRATQGSLAGHIAYVGDAAPIIGGTVEKNLRLGAPEASSDDIDAVLSQFDLFALAARCNRVAALGRNLSSGERARLMTARALLAKPRILLLDEIEANLDDVSEALVWAAVRSFQGLVIFATHDPARMASADKVWTIKSGRLVEHVPQDPKIAITEVR